MLHTGGWVHMNRQRAPEIFRDKQSFILRKEELRTEGYLLADLHVHSSLSDGCHSLKSLAAVSGHAGLSIAVTDHNRIPDLTVLPVSDIARIIPAIEVTSRDYIDILCYFYDSQSLAEFYRVVVEPHRLRPYMIDLSCNEILLALAGRRCVVTIPHPDYPANSQRMNFLRLVSEGGVSEEALRAVHCLEVFNASRDSGICHRKMQLAEQLGKFPIVGSDAHTRAAVGNGVVYCRARDHGGLLDQIARGTFASMAIPTGLAGRTLPKAKMAWLHIKGLLGHR